MLNFSLILRITISPEPDEPVHLSFIEFYSRWRQQLKEIVSNCLS